MTSATSSTSPMPGGGEAMRKPKWNVTARVEDSMIVTVYADDENEAVEKAALILDCQGLEPIGSMRCERCRTMPDQSIEHGNPQPT